MAKEFKANFLYRNLDDDGDVLHTPSSLCITQQRQAKHKVGDIPNGFKN